MRAAEADVQAALDGIRRLVRVLRLSDRQSEREAGVSAAQLFVLQKLAEGPAPSVNDLAERTLTHQSSVSVVVGRLVERGLVVRSPSRQDGRRREPRLTLTGRALLRRSPRPAQLRLIRALRALGPAETRALARLLGRLVAGMGAASQPAAMFFEGDDR
jgi:MarR family transcriptional regulator, lower aerobic nicotinate degradation pathway regulator